MISIEIEDVPDDQWNERLLKINTGTFFQTKEFGQSKKLVGYKPQFMKFVDNNGRITGQLLLFLIPTKNKIIKKLHNLSFKNRPLIRWFYGPIIFDEKNFIEIKKKLFDYLLSNNYKVWGSVTPIDNFSSAFGYPFTIQNWSTFILDLINSRDSLWEKLDKHSARKNIERAEKKDVSIKKMQKSDLLIYNNINDNTIFEKNEKISLLGKHWDILQPIGYHGMLAYKEGIPIGGIKFCSFNGYIYEFEIARTKQDSMEKLYSQDLLKWKVIEWGLENNLRYYDLGGINPDPRTEKEMGIYRYKKKWGGKKIDYPILKFGLKKTSL